MAVYRPTYTDPKTGKKKQSEHWWIDFTIGGKRYRESAETARKTIATEYEKRRRLDLERSHAGMPVERPESRIVSVREALKAYRAKYPVNHRAKSVLVVENRSAHLERLLGSVLVSDLTEDRIIEYMRTRQQEGASGRTINIELGVLSRAFKRKWNAIWPEVKKLDENHDIGKALEPDQERALIDAASKNRSPLIYPFLQTLVWTGMRSDEARTLRWAQVDFGAGQIGVGKAKTEAGTGRTIPIGGTLRAVLEQHAAWYARKLGPIQPGWYVFPLSNRIKPVDPTKPVTSLKRAWETVRETAKLECRLHDLRHSFCTKMAEAGVAESTMLDIMGHMSAAMLRRYSHIRAQARRDAIAAVEAVHALVTSKERQSGPISSVESSVTH